MAINSSDAQNKSVNTNKLALYAGILAITASSILSSCNHTSKKDQEKIINLNHLALHPQQLKDSIKNLGFTEIGKLISLTPDSVLDATVMQQSLNVFGKDSISLWPLQARVRLVKAGLVDTTEAHISQADMPAATNEEKVLYHGEGTPKVIDFVEKRDLYKTVIIVLQSQNEKNQLREALDKKDAHWKLLSQNPAYNTYSHNGSTIYVVQPNHVEAFAKEKDKLQAGLIILKGHCGMIPELESVSKLGVPGSTILFAGGCRSFGSTSEYLQKGFYPITNSQTGIGAINDPLTIKLVNDLPKLGAEATFADYKKENPKNDEKIVFPTDNEAQRVNGMQ